MNFGPSRDNAFAKALVAALVKDLPPQAMEAQRGSMSVNKITRQLEKTYKAAIDYQREQRIGFIRRAFLANGFRWELKSSGYPDDFISVATEGLVVELSRARNEGTRSQG
jgi:hypothetical protein